MFKINYRVVTDQYLGYEAQVKYWWCPFWIQLGRANSHLSIEKAVEYINHYRERKAFKSKPVLYVE